MDVAAEDRNYRGRMMALNATTLMTRYLALLTVLANVLVVAGIGLLWATRGGRGSDTARELRSLAGRYGLALAWLVALVSTLGSLYYSEVANFIPCKLCWYQRIAMYPLVVILGIAAWRHDRNVRRYALPMVGIGAAISIYHYVIQRFPDLAGSSCDPNAPCSFVWVWQFHYISIPFQALSGFLLIALLLLMTRPDEEGEGT